MLIYSPTTPASNKELLIKKSQKVITTSEKINKIISKKNDASSSNKISPQTTLELLYSYVPDLSKHLQKNDTTLVCLFSMTCSHCQEVYRDISSMKSSSKLPPIYLVNYGSEY